MPLEKLLITGGTGFLGRHLARALKKKYEITLTGRNAHQNRQAEVETGCPVFPMDVTRIESVRDVFNRARPSIVVHAAATKSVGVSEEHPMECIDINVLGSQNIARAAIDKEVKTVIGISTDKATPPIYNTYGLSKALMERLYSSINQKAETKFLCVRYGNVAWSTGSIFPIWREMMEKRKTIESTGAEMTRFFFSVKEAVFLVTTAIEHSESLAGKILIQEMKSARIGDILDVWTKEFGGTWLPVSQRSGDRSYECLVGEAELENATLTDFNGKNHFVLCFDRKSQTPLREAVCSRTAKRMSREEILCLLKERP